VDLDALLAVPFAHRGLHDSSVPENSLWAFDRAAMAGLGVELDVQLSADGVAVVHHDRTLLRMCGVDQRVADIGAVRLRRIRLADTSETVSTLADALDLIDGRVPVLLDLKSGMSLPGRRRLVETVAADLVGYDGATGVVGFDPLLLNGVGARAPQVAVGQTGGVDLAALHRRWWLRAACHPVDALWSRRLSRPHFLAFNVGRLPSEVVARLRRALPVVAWTARTAADYALARACADAVIVEDAAVALALRDRS
jgi:glycerophosphoryl diester phosphodiesterase